MKSKNLLLELKKIQYHSGIISEADYLKEVDTVADLSVDAINFSTKNRSELKRAETIIQTILANLKNPTFNQKVSTDVGLDTYFDVLNDVVNRLYDLTNPNNFKKLVNTKASLNPNPAALDIAIRKIPPTVKNPPTVKVP